MKLWIYDITGTPEECDNKLLDLFDVPRDPAFMIRHERNVEAARRDLAGLPASWRRIRVRGYGTTAPYSQGVHITMLESAQ